MAFTLTTAGAAKYAAATNTSRIQYRDVRFGTGHQADQAAATALATPIPAAIYPIRDPSGQSKFTIVEHQNAADGVVGFISTDMSADAFTATEAGLFDTDGVLMAYESVSTGSLVIKTATGTMDYVVRLAYQAAAAAPTTWQSGAVLPATTSRVGLVELATSDEAVAGTDAVRAVTPAADKAALDDRIATEAEIAAGTNTIKYAPVNLLPKALDVQEFTSDGTWNKPAGAQLVIAELVGGGGGAALLTWSGGETSWAAGGGGAFAQYLIAADDLDATESVVVGAGGRGDYTPAADGGNSDSAVVGSASMLGAAALGIVANGGGRGLQNSGSFGIQGMGGAASTGAVISEAGGSGVVRDSGAAPQLSAIPTEVADQTRRSGRGGAIVTGTHATAAQRENAFGNEYGQGGNIPIAALTDNDLMGRAGFVRVITLRG